MMSSFLREFKGDTKLIVTYIEPQSIKNEDLTELVNT